MRESFLLKLVGVSGQFPFLVHKKKRERGGSFSQNGFCVAVIRNNETVSEMSNARGYCTGFPCTHTRWQSTHN